MANKSNAKKKPNAQDLKKLRSALKRTITSIDKVQNLTPDHLQDEEVLFHIAFYLRLLYHRGTAFVHLHGLSYI